MVGTWHGLVIDCANPRTLATFYEQLLGLTRVQDDEGWVVIGKSADHAGIAFQRIPDYVAPTWPTSDVPTQMHIDVRVDDLAVVAEQAQVRGATLLKQTSDTFWVMADPEGHPFCIVHF